MSKAMLASPAPPLRVLLGKAVRRKLWIKRQLRSMPFMFSRFPALPSTGNDDMAVRRGTQLPEDRTPLHVQSVPPLNEIEVLEEADRAGLQGIASTSITQ